MSSSKQQINKDVTQADLIDILEKLSNLEKSFISEASTFLQADKKEGTLFTMDYYISAIVNRAISLNSGFTILANHNNYISAVPLIRLQVDNLLRLYAATIVKNRDKFFIQYLKGEHIRNMIDAQGKKMTDSYLARKIDKELYPGILNLYENTSGHIHLSNEHAFLQAEIINSEERRLAIRIGQYDFFKIEQKVDFAFNMYKASEFVFRLVRGWTIHKANINTTSQTTNP